MRAEGQVTYIQAHEEKLIDEGEKNQAKSMCKTQTKTCIQHNLT